MSEKIECPLDVEDYTLDLLSSQANYLGFLIEQAKINDQEKVDLEKEIINGMDLERSEKLILWLKNLQPDMLSDKGGQGGATELNKAILKRIAREK